MTEIGPIDAALAYSVPVAAKLIGLSERRVWDLVGDKEIKSFVHGARRLISRRALEQFVVEREADACMAPAGAEVLHHWWPVALSAEILYPVAEVAVLWRCSKNHVYDLIASGDLRSVNLNRSRAKTRIPESALAEFIAKHTRATHRRT